MSQISTTLRHLKTGFDRLAIILRAELWAAAAAEGMNPAQAQVLALLVTRPDGMRSKNIAAQLAVSGASITETVNALVRKKLLIRTADTSDARASIICATPEGHAVNAAIEESSSRFSEALASLPASVQSELLATQIRLIHELQQAGAIPLQRMCVSCRHFRPNIHPGSSHPHHCTFIGADIAGTDLRLDCGEHEAADQTAQDVNWAAFTQNPDRNISGTQKLPDTVVHGP